MRRSREVGSMKREGYVEIPMLKISDEEARNHRPVVNCGALLVCADCRLVLGRVYVIHHKLEES